MKLDKLNKEINIKICLSNEDIIFLNKYSTDFYTTFDEIISHSIKLLKKEYIRKKYYYYIPKNQKSFFKLIE